MSEDYLHYDDVKLEYKTVTGLVDSHVRFWGNNEDSYRYTQCTHRQCATDGCNNATEKYRNFCESCSEKMAVEEYKKAPKAKYDTCEEFFYSNLTGEYYESIDYAEDEAHERGITIEDMRLYHCERESAPYVDLENVYEGITPEEFDPCEMWTDEIQAACDRLNKLLADHPVNCLNPSKVALDTSDERLANKAEKQ